ncbi:MAG: RIP metalloprotease RseP [Erysipelotrichaceae bacterium]
MSVVYFIILIGFLTLVHELGHFIAAKIFGVYCHEFAIGFGPTLFSFKGKETKYALRALPLGGFVSMAGESDEVKNDVVVPVNRTIKGINRFKQIIIMLSGVLMNFIIALLLFISINAINGKVVIPPPAVIDQVLENSPAQAAGMLKGDKILEITFENKKVIKPTDYYDMINKIGAYNSTMIFTVDRNNEKMDLYVTPRFDEPSNRYLIGITSAKSTIKEISFFEAVNYGFKEFQNSIGNLVHVIGQLFNGYGLDQLSGPIGIFEVTNQFAQSGILPFLSLMAFLSLNLAIFNLLPVPLLDGGRVVITVIEAIIRKPLNEKLVNVLMMASIALVFGLLILSTFNDITRIFG